MSCFAWTRGCNRLCDCDHYSNKRLYDTGTTNSLYVCQEHCRVSFFLFLFFQFFLFLFLFWLPSSYALNAGKACCADSRTRRCSSGIEKPSFPGEEQEERTDAAPRAGGASQQAACFLQSMNPLSRLDIGTRHFCKPGTTRKTLHFNFFRLGFWVSGDSCLPASSSRSGGV